MYVEGTEIIAYRKDSNKLGDDFLDDIRIQSFVN